MRGRHAVARSAEQIKRIKPLVKGRAGALERRSYAGIDVVAAPFTLIGAALAKSIERSLPVARPLFVLGTSNSCFFTDR